MSYNSLNKCNFFNVGRIFTPEVFIQSKKVWGMRSVTFDIPRSFTVILLISFDFRHFLT